MVSARPVTPRMLSVSGVSSESPTTMLKLPRKTPVFTPVSVTGIWIPPPRDRSSSVPAAPSQPTKVPLVLQATVRSAEEDPMTTQNFSADVAMRLKLASVISTKAVLSAPTFSAPKNDVAAASTARLALPQSLVQCLNAMVAAEAAVVVPLLTFVVTELTAVSAAPFARFASTYLTTTSEPLRTRRLPPEEEKPETGPGAASSSQSSAAPETVPSAPEPVWNLKQPRKTPPPTDVRVTGRPTGSFVEVARTVGGLVRSRS